MLQVFLGRTNSSLELPEKCIALIASPHLGLHGSWTVMLDMNGLSTLS